MRCGRLRQSIGPERSRPGRSLSFFTAGQRNKILSCFSMASLPERRGHDTGLLGSDSRNFRTCRFFTPIGFFYQPVANSLRAPRIPHFWYLS